MDQGVWGEDCQEYRQECQRLSRPHQVVSLTKAPLMDRDNQCTGVVLVIRDLTREVAPAEDLIERYRSYNIIGKSLPMQKVYRQLDDLRHTETTVLITGETGTGKELVAVALHYGGLRAARTFVKVDCTALAETLLESELFGHVKGAFTGAHKDRVGRLQLAQGGTIFLDEIGDVSLKTQVKLLRAIEEKRFERVGDSTTSQADVRIIAATHHDLRQLVNQGQFRQDLYFRLKVFEVSLPPLRDRLDDLPLLVEHFCRVLNQAYNKHVDAVLPEVFEVFHSYRWPGNVRELKHVLEHAFVQCHGSTITLEHLPADLREATAAVTFSLDDKKDFSAQELVQALERTDGNKSKAARLLGISRPTLYRLLAIYNLSKLAQ
jgi:two-component system response regulator HydG